MDKVNFADLDGRYQNTPAQLVGMYPLGGGGLVEAPYRHYFELQHLSKIVRFHHAMNVLELGSGNGRWAVSLAPLVSDYTGVDLTPRAIEIAQGVVSGRMIKNVTFHEMSILDFKGDRPYDVIYFSSVSQYLEDDQIHQVLNNLSSWVTPSTIIVDRSTVKYRQREILERPGYYSILRTPDELDKIFKEHGFALSYYKRSYRFLRGAQFLIHPPLNRILPAIVKWTQPVSLYLMLALSWIADIINPIPFKEDDWSHDFLLFKQFGRPD